MSPRALSLVARSFLILAISSSYRSLGTFMSCSVSVQNDA
jgi:hypothetical protein